MTNQSTMTKVMHFVSRNVIWTLGCAVNCVATVDLTNRHNRIVIWKTKAGIFSNDRQERNTRQARDRYRCSTFGVISCIATFTVTGCYCTGDNRPEFILREGKQAVAWGLKGNCEEAKRHLVSCVKYRLILNYECYEAVRDCVWSSLVWKC